MKALVVAIDQEEAFVGAFSVITNLRMDLRFNLCWRHGIRHAVWSAASGADNTASFTPAGYNEDWALLLRLLGLGPCNIIDIGANDGDTTLNLALAAAGGTVLAFEMGPQVELLQYNVR